MKRATLLGLSIRTMDVGSGGSDEAETIQDVKTTISGNMDKSRDFARYGQNVWSKW